MARFDSGGGCDTRGQRHTRFRAGWWPYAALSHSSYRPAPMQRPAALVCQQLGGRRVRRSPPACGSAHPLQDECKDTTRAWTQEPQRQGRQEGEKDNNRFKLFGVPTILSCLLLLELSSKFQRPVPNAEVSGWLRALQRPAAETRRDAERRADGHSRQLPTTAADRLQRQRERAKTAHTFTRSDYKKHTHKQGTVFSHVSHRLPEGKCAACSTNGREVTSPPRLGLLRR